MKNIIKRVWQKIKLSVIVALALIIGASWTYSAERFIEVKKESEKVWEDHIDRQIDAEKVRGETPSAKPEVNEPAEGAEDNPTGELSLAPAGDIETILDKVRILESSGGKNDSCKAKGLINGYGFSQSTFSWKCFKSHEEVRTLVASWYEDKFAKGYTLEESLCYYNRGIKTNSCEYAQKFKTL